MKLAAMRFKDYVWPHNPKTFEASVSRKLAVAKIPFGKYVMTNLGIGVRVFSGEGEFVGKNAYKEFKKLEKVFYSDEPGMLTHPVLGSANVYFASLAIMQEPFSDYVRYSFEFWEAV